MIHVRVGTSPTTISKGTTMKTLSALIVSLFFINVAIASDTVVGVHVASWHSEKGYNNSNPGVFVRKNNIQTGIYKNSVNKTTVYAGVTKDVQITKNISVGGMLGAATGYSNSVVPMLVTSVKIGDNVRVSYIPQVKTKKFYTPHVVHASVEFKF